MIYTIKRSKKLKCYSYQEYNFIGQGRFDKDRQEIYSPVLRKIQANITT